MRPSDWYNDFLSSRDLDRPHNGPLYSYMVKDHEFSSLRESLKSTDFNQYSYQLWDACFVLYVTEWWRRNYSSGHWSWFNILKSINKKFNNPTQRSDLIRSGFKRWGRSIYNHNGTSEYLVTVILECGLPLGAVINEGGWLRKVIKQSFEEIVQISSSQVDLADIVQENAVRLRLPLSMRNNQFYALLSKIVFELRQLKADYNLGEQKQPVSFLDINKPDWRKAFPIQIDSDEVKIFLNQLLTDIAQVAKPIPYKIELRRKIHKSGSEWRFTGSVIIPSGAYSSSELRFDHEIFENLPSKVELQLHTSSGGSQVVGHALKIEKNGETVLKISKTDHPIPQDDLFEEWSLHIVTLTEQYKIPLLGGNAVNTDAPMSFVDNAGNWELKSNASYRTHKLTTLVVASNDTAAIGDCFLIAQQINQSKIYKVSGQAQFIIDDRRYTIATNSTKDVEFRYVLAGQQFHFRLNQREVTYIGLPKIYKEFKESLYKTSSDGIQQWRQKNGTSWSHYRYDVFGLIEVRLIGKDDEILFEKTLRILPSDFAIDLESSTPEEGRVILSNTIDYNVTVIGEKVESKIELFDGGHLINVWSTDKIPPRSVF